MNISFILDRIPPYAISKLYNEVVGKEDADSKMVAAYIEQYMGGYAVEGQILLDAFTFHRMLLAFNLILIKADKVHYALQFWMFVQTVFEELDTPFAKEVLELIDKYNDKNN